MKRKLLLYVFVIILFSSICGCNQNGQGSLQENVGSEQYSDNSDVSVKNKNDKEENAKTSSEKKKKEEFSCIDGDVIVDGKLVDKLALVEEDLIVNVSAADRNQEMNGLLWGKSLYGDGYLTLSYHYIKDNQIYKLNDFYEEIKMFDIASSGNAIAYYTENDTINLLNAKDETVEKITCVRGDLDYGVVVSPDGKTVAYSNGKSIYMYRNGLFEEVYTHYSSGYIGIISVTDNGRDVFYYSFQTDNPCRTVWCKSRGKEAKKIVEMEDCRAIIANSKKTQLGLYDVNDSSMNLYIYDTESGKLNRINCINGCYPLVGYTDSGVLGDRGKFIAKTKVTTYNTDDLFECYYSSGDVNGGDVFYSGICCIENYEMKELVSSCIYRLSALSDNQWLCLDNMQKMFIYEEGKKEKVIHEGVASFTVGTDNETVYFITKDNELYRYTTSEKNKIASDVSFYMSNICVVGSDIVIWQRNEEDTVIPIGGDYFMYQKGKVKEVDKSIEYSMSQTNLTSTYINPSINILERNSRGRIFTTSYLPYIQNGDVLILHDNGELEHVGTE